MRLELSRVEPLRAANVMACVYALVMLAFVVIFLPIVLVIFVIGAAAGDDPSAALGGAVGFLVILLAYPIMGLIFGWIGGFLSSWIYNLIAGWIGGFQVTFSQLDLPPAAAPPTQYPG